LVSPEGRATKTYVTYYIYGIVKLHKHITYYWKIVIK